MQEQESAVPSTEERQRGDRAERRVRQCLESASVVGAQQDAVVEALRTAFNFRDAWAHGQRVEGGLVAHSPGGAVMQFGGRRDTDWYQSVLQTPWEDRW